MKACFVLTTWMCALVILATTPAKAQGRPNSDQKTTLVRQLEATLKRPMRFEFNRVALSAVVGEVQRMTGVPIAMDGPALRRAGISPEHPVTARLVLEPLELALKETPAPLRLQFLIKNETLLITPIESDDFMETRRYPVDDLILRESILEKLRQRGIQLECHGSLKLDLLMVHGIWFTEAVTSSCPAGSWVNAGGVGEILRVVPDMACVVRQSAVNHERIAVALSVLRALNRAIPAAD